MEAVVRNIAVGALVKCIKVSEIYIVELKTLAAVV